MSLIVYPDSGYNSFADEDTADEYMETRLNASAWDACTEKEAALLTAYRSLMELDLEIDADDSSGAFLVMEQAQIEQALHEIRIDSDTQAVSALKIGSQISFKIPESKTPPSRYSKRALAILKPYMSAPTITRTR